jgi:Chromosome segregation ATPases
MAKILLIVAIVVSAATAVLGFMNQSSFKETKAQLEQTDASLQSAKKSLADTTKKLTDTEEQLSATTADKDKLAADVAAANDAASKAAAAQKAAEAELADAQKALADANSEIDRLKNEVVAGGPVQDNTSTGDSERVAELEAMVARLESDITTAKARVAELEGKESARRQGLMAKGLEGQVLAVNPAWNFVVLSIGDRQGVTNNAELLLKRGNQYLGKVRVTSVEPSTSIADIVANSLPTGVSVQPGDSVIYQGSEE